MLENKLEEKCCKKVEVCGGMAIKLKSPGYRGLPDRMMLLPGGKAFFVEFKKTRTGVLSPQQKKIIREIQELDFPVYVIDDVEDFEVCLAQEK